MLNLTATRSNLGVHQDASACAIRVMKQLFRKLGCFPLVRSTEHGSSALLSSKIQTRSYRRACVALTGSPKTLALTVFKLGKIIFTGGQGSLDRRVLGSSSQSSADSPRADQ